MTTPSPPATSPAARPSARVILVDEEGSVLLFRVEDPLDDKPAVWATPGGGIEPGETLSEAAARELFEETGLVRDPAELGRPVAVTRGEWVFRKELLYSEDWFFLCRTHGFDPDISGWTELERVVHRAWRWWAPDDLDRQSEPVLPAGLTDLVRSVLAGTLGSETIELPWFVPGAG
jgi:8-oxo-dGTP pyrophosphatase MutT (NUDIX family)